MRSLFKSSVLLLVAIALVAPLFAHATGTVKQASTSGLVGWWRFDEGSGGYAHDFSGNGNTGTLAGGTSWSSGKRGKAITLDGSSAYVDIGNSTSLAAGNTDWTVSAWVKTTATADGVVIARGGASYEYYLKVAANGQPEFEIWTSPTLTTVTGPSPINDGKWHHLVGTFNSTTMNLYVDGAQYTGPGQWVGVNPAEQTEIGYDAGSTCCGSYFFNGSIDDVREYNRMLSGSEVSQLYRGGEVVRKVADNTGLLAYYSFNEGNGTQAHDGSGNGRTANFVGSPSWTSGKYSYGVNTGNTVSDFVATPIVSIGSTWTLTAWFKYPLSGTGGSWNTLFRGNGGDHQVIVQRSNQHLGMYDNNGSGFNDTGFNMSTLSTGWHHIAVTGTGGVQTFFIDGTQIGTTPKQSTTDIYAMGNYQGGGQNWGTFDDVRIYGRVLSATEILNMYRQHGAIVNASEKKRVTDGLVGYWTFNGSDLTTTSALDISGYGNNGAFMGSPAPTPTIGKVGQAIMFNGSTNYIEVPNSASLNPSRLTINVWAKSNTSTWNENGFLVSKRDVYIIHPNIGTTNVAFYINSGSGWYSSSCTAPQAITLWNMYTLTWDGTSLSCYINASLGQTTQPGISINTADTGPLDIGKDDGLSRYFNGAEDEVRIYNRALSTTEIKQLYQMGK